MFSVLKRLGVAGVVAAASLAAILGAAMPASAQNAADYMVQSVCVSTADVALPLDPATCGASGYTIRPLKVGEALPYHKHDVGNYQVSDTFPFDAGINSPTIKAVQTYFFTSSYGTDPRFGSAQPFLDATNGGYNILAVDGSYLGFEGTVDPSGGWQPWWKSSCQTGGWLLMPSGSGAVTTTMSALTDSPTDHAPDCTTTPFTTTASKVRWKRINTFTYESGKSLDSLVGYHFSAGLHALEVSYLTRQYGVTRFEAWIDNVTGYDQSYAHARCPTAPLTMTLSSVSYWLIDCRDWSNIDLLSTPWDPNGPAANDANVIAWHVDPLYRTRNLIKDAHWARDSSNNCVLGSNWARINSPDVLNWAWDSRVPTSTSPWPFTSGGNCSLIFSTPSTGAGQVLYQVVPVGSHLTATGTFGATLWAPDWTGGSNPGLVARLFQSDASGALLSYTDIDASAPLSLSGKPATYGHTFILQPATASLTLAFYPITANTNIEITGAWISLDPYQVR